MVHRSYLDHGMIQVAIYDDRLEITSPGKLPMGQTIERMKKGYSKIRNEALAYAFSYMNLIEHWGSGIPRIIGKVKAAGLQEPEFIGGDVDLRINIYRSQSTANSATNNATINANGTENGVNDVNVMTTKEQEQVKKLLDAIEKKPICNAGILCGTDWRIKKNGLQNFRFFAGKRYFDANRNEKKVKLGDREVGDDYDKGVLI